ncbi:NUDIX hydrolase [Pseudomonas putida]|nr:NUDIX hydrolase [Pseudomonas putida]
MSTFRKSPIFQVRSLMSVIKHRPTSAKVTIICSRNDQVLLVRRKGAKWKFPSALLAAGESPIMAAARELWKALSLHCSRLNAVGTLEVGRVLHHIFNADLTDGCSVSLGRGIVDCKWIGWEDLSSTMLKPTAAALLSRDLSALVHRDDPAALELASDTN